MMRIFKILLFCTPLFLFAGCKGCAKNQLGNGDANPSDIHLGMSGTDIAVQIEGELTNGACDYPNDFDANVQIRVLTASVDDNGNIIPNPAPYSTIDDDYHFSPGTPLGNGGKTVIVVKVPETGAYALDIQIRPTACSDCCKDVDFTRNQSTAPNPDLRCDGNLGENRCPTGKPTLIGMFVYTQETRPKSTSNQFPLNLVPDCTAGLCRGCGSCPTVPCN